ncbi:MAG: rhodanese-like domain-containing protein [Bacteroidia bacterium]|nr:rhodanese-like domain-containing protein [Bacteroidia bacterium]
MKKLHYIMSFLLVIACGSKENIPITDVQEDALENALLIDVRTPEEYSLGHLNEAININWYDIDFKDRIGALDRSKTVYVYCKAGGRSAKAAAVFRELGFKDVVNLEGGYDVYLEAKE